MTGEWCFGFSRKEVRQAGRGAGGLQTGKARSLDSDILSLSCLRGAHLAAAKQAGG